MFLWDFCSSLSFDGKQFSDIGHSELFAGEKICQVLLSGIVQINPDSYGCFEMKFILDACYLILE